MCPSPSLYHSISPTLRPLSLPYQSVHQLSVCLPSAWLICWLASGLSWCRRGHGAWSGFWGDQCHIPELLADFMPIRFPAQVCSLGTDNRFSLFLCENANGQQEKINNKTSHVMLCSQLIFNLCTRVNNIFIYITFPGRHFVYFKTSLGGWYFFAVGCRI